MLNPPSVHVIVNIPISVRDREILLCSLITDSSVDLSCQGRDFCKTLLIMNI